MKYGLTDTEINKLCDLFARYKEIEKVLLYGSRAKGNYKPFSDVDLTLIGEKLTHSDINQITWAIDYLLLPYQFDISLFHKLTNPDLMEHIQRKGIVFYQKKS